MTDRILCRLDDIDDPGARAFDIGDGRPEVVVFRVGEAVHAYRNDCPHLNITLDFVPGRFMNLDATMIQCSNHGARFNIHDGRCVWGPCRGEWLERVAVRLEDGRVVLDEAAGTADNPD